MDIFQVNRKLLNPKFEGYKLDPVDQDQAVSRFHLPHKVSQSTAPTRSLLSFQEVQSRITHNHLHVSSNGAIYIDEGYNVVLISVAPDSLIPTWKTIYEIPKVIKSGDVEIHPEYPSSHFLSDSLLFVSDGHGSMYLLRPSATGPYHLVGTCQLPNSIPFRIHTAVLVSPEIALVVLSSRNYEAKPPTSSGSTKKASAVEFDIWAAKFDLTSGGSPENVKVMDIIWQRRGEDVPISVILDESRKAFAIIGGSPYRTIGTQPLHTYTPSADEIAPIPRAGEHLDATSTSNEPPKPPPYSWTQTSDSVTVAFPLLSTTQKSQINVRFTSDSLTLSIDGSVEDPSLPAPLPKFASKQLWDRISPSSSYWTWDRDADHKFGLLTLHLDKQHEGTKWMQVFASAGTKPTSEASPEDMEVPETLDPSEIWHIREALEKYTTALRTGEDASGLGLGKGVPGLAEGEMDEEVDSSVGRKTFITWIAVDGGTSPSWAAAGREYPFQLLSTPLPGWRTADSAASLIVKEGLDGAVYRLSNGTGDVAPTWEHVSTFSALAFVLASKRDLRFTHHTQDTVFALENGARYRGGNAYIYRIVPRGEKWAKQAILKVGDGNGGALLGVGAIGSQGKPALLCLTETELVIVRV
ncbi:tumor antigen cml66-l [Moniliophthora roreri MCA 2997]|uniref:NudC domain-containing protein 1 n=2 Tax=Moniliophthora roreri TaxID=221103 RepID=V2YTK2_MONRO|nr:tumor antigen cml66-l [Moniliophthora roreri MCA 2997]KAI3607840.1 tumor antigen cml66-l [Moniliophthora roreri]